MKSFSLFVAMVSTSAEAGQCPWQYHGCRNAAGECNTDCAESPWYASDGKCVCGPASSDWMTSGQCKQCSADEAEVVSTEAEVAGQCPWQSHGCRNAAGECNTDCAVSPWYASDGKCVCGPANSDWMTSGQCYECSANEAEIVSTEAEVAGQCPWQSHGCLNAAGQCNTDCAVSPWYASDGKCVCGPASSDWMTSGQCKRCSANEAEVVSTEAEVVGQCPWQSHGCLNAAGGCNKDCAVSPWYASDGKCVCGPASSDWMTSSQCVQCSAEDAAVVSTEAEVAGQCPWQSHGCLNAAGQCNADCAESPWYNSDGKCVCGPASSDWMTSSQCVKCSAEDVAVVSTEAEVAGQCPWQNNGCRNAAGECNTDCAESPWYASDGKCVCGPETSDWVTVGQCIFCTTDEFV